ncbi:hypothetical protein QBC40DRAFT_251113 [Triangularia verruculosa]|uniref:CFEM domain-containing protein n=1 Tax=Triangularia verruculosa TaxID=2587418 RepID=A0AAN6XMA6_9PEZI|nr:hypothetical protein QBC40DRAFT_251113 [Triangularia verruculosa]
MKFLTTVLALLPLVYAASIPETSLAVNNVLGGDEDDLKDCLTAAKELHTCSIPCLVSAAEPVGCWPLDMNCMCGKKEKFFKEAKQCVTEKCGKTKSAEILAATRKVCQVCI